MAKAKKTDKTTDKPKKGPRQTEIPGTERKKISLSDKTKLKVHKKKPEAFKTEGDE